MRNENNWGRTSHKVMRWRHLGQSQTSAALCSKSTKIAGARGELDVGAAIIQNGSLASVT